MIDKTDKIIRKRTKTNKETKTDTWGAFFRKPPCPFSLLAVFIKGQIFVVSLSVFLCFVI